MRAGQEFGSYVHCKNVNSFSVDDGDRKSNLFDPKTFLDDCLFDTIHLSFSIFDRMIGPLICWLRIDLDETAWVQ